MAAIVQVTAVDRLAMRIERASQYAECGNRSLKLAWTTGEQVSGALLALGEAWLELAVRVIATEPLGVQATAVGPESPAPAMDVVPEWVSISKHAAEFSLAMFDLAASDQEKESWIHKASEWGLLAIRLSKLRLNSWNCDTIRLVDEALRRVGVWSEEVYRQKLLVNRSEELVWECRGAIARANAILDRSGTSRDNFETIGQDNYQNWFVEPAPRPGQSEIAWPAHSARGPHETPRVS